VDCTVIIFYDNQERGLIKFSITEFHIPMKLVRSIKMSLNNIYIKILVGKHFIISKSEVSEERRCLSALLVNFPL
jgi:hypothetical protein